MNAKYNYFDENDPYSEYAAEFDPMENDRKARRKRKRTPNHEPKLWSAYGTPDADPQAGGEEQNRSC